MQAVGETGAKLKFGNDVVKEASRCGRAASRAWKIDDKILSRVYANRLGNGPEESGDGWRYRGRGVLQITGRANYERFARETGIDLVGNPDLAADANVALLIATTFWYNNGLNELADQGDLEGITRKINGSLNGLADRERFTSSAQALLARMPGGAQP